LRVLTLRVVTLSPQWQDAYKHFLLSCETSLIYHSVEYRDFLEQIAGGEPEYLLALDDRDKICGALPLFFKTGAHGTICNSLPFFGSIGGLVGATAEARSALLARFNRRIAEPEIAAATVIENPLERRDNDDIKRDITDFRIGQVTPLDGDGDIADRLMSIFHQKTRNMVRKAEKSGIKVNVDNTAFGFLEKVHNENMAAIGGLVKPPAFFALVQQRFAPGHGRRLYVATHEGRTVAAALMLYFNKTVEYFIPVIRSEFRQFQPLSLIVYQAMIDAARDGYRTWNWGGTWQSQEGVYHFKKRWGTQDRKYTYYTRIKNRKVLMLSREEILREYPWYFVVPFAALQSPKAP
jgi:hypothetical protein